MHGVAAAIELIEPLMPELDGYFYFHGARGALLKVGGCVVPLRLRAKQT